MAEFLQNAVSKAVWPWTRHGAEAPELSGSRLRRQGLTQAAVGATAALCLVVIPPEPRLTLAGTVFCIGVVLALTAFAAPAVSARLDRAFARFGRVLGTALTWVLLVPFFFVCFLGGRAILVVRRLDPLRRSFPAPENSCWVPRPPVVDRDHYTRLY